MENTRYEGRWVTWVYLTDCLPLSWDIVFTQHRLHQDNEQSPISGDRWHTGGCMTPAEINLGERRDNCGVGASKLPSQGTLRSNKVLIVLDLTDGSDLITRTNRRRRVWGLRLEGGASLGPEYPTDAWPGHPAYSAYLILSGVTHSGGWGGITFTLDLQLIHYIGSASR